MPQGFPPTVIILHNTFYISLSIFLFHFHSLLCYPVLFMYILQTLTMRLLLKYHNSFSYTSYFQICYLIFIISSLVFVLCYLLCVSWYLLFAMCYLFMFFVIWYVLCVPCSVLSVICSCYLIFIIYYWSSVMCYLLFVTSYLLFVCC